MNDAMTVSEATFALAVIAVLAGLVGLVYRTKYLGRQGNMAVLAIRYPNGNWRTGMARYRSDRLEWFSFRTLRLQPELSWARGDFFLGSRQSLDAGDRPRAMTGEAVKVDVECGPQKFAIAMAPGDYTALRSWSESAPPGYRV